MISHIDHLVLTVSDIERAVAFYSGAFKMEPITFGAGRRALRFGNQKINLQLLGEEARNRAQVGSGDLCLITSWPLDQVMAQLASQGVEIVEGPVMKSGACGPILNAKGDSLRRRWEGNFAGASAPLVLNVLLDHLQRCSAARARKVRA
ncbi:hypothetical protein KAM353_18900 [Aeromonas caviae]|uniref:VOC domain-containing protein n=9 Tax=Aeromonas caviae TaxID=648 RepID=A0AA37CX25_AERCA|nr:hypothetical protein KAM345_014290 [Aeromonas caviae]BDC87600.1 hypothetical protein NUITMVA2_29570 [Aeromonas caviae]BDN87601.1 hypothetical protein KAM471c_14160 [Aeromonas caviae]BDN91870.1 hypothetical protein KAM497c_14140 [Aeromonas caviae]GJA27800.1 hypothetical protein KAM340_19670 [Aeromonas caviae]